VTVPQLIRRRRAHQRCMEARRLNRGLASAAEDLRARAVALTAAGYPEQARPFLDEAELFESAALAPVGL
jgi:hypothetical protein